MSDVYIVLSASNKWFGKAIRWITKSNVNHAFIMYTSHQWGDDWAVEIDDRGVVKLPLKTVMKEYNYIEVYGIKHADMGIAMKRFKNHVGVRYDWWGVVGFLFKIIMWRLFGRKSRNILHRKDKQFCSEAVVTFLQKAKNAPPG
jgi:hypothetical protein